jgi:rhamnogalacturonyl hydrolase YesR
MNRIKILLLLTVIVFISTISFGQKVNVKKQFQNAGRQATYMLATIDSLKSSGLPADLVAPRTSEKNKLKMVKGTDWTSGFFSGELWFLYQQTGDKNLLAAAKKYTALLEPVKYFGGTHDLGFMMYCSFGNGYRLTGDTSYRSVIVQSAKTLSTRFSPVTGVIKSWDFASDNKWKYPVIIDNMMNLELLFEATKLTGDSSFYRIAVTHANTTIKNHFGG